MSLRFPALCIVFLQCFLRVHSNIWVQDESFPPFLGFQLPEIDGSPVVDTCRIFNTESDSGPVTASPKPTTRLVTRKQVVQSSPRKQVTKAPIGRQPSAGGPIRNHNTNQALVLLYKLLANSRRRLPVSQPRGGLNVMSSSDESAAVWKIGAASSENSSDES